MTSSEEFQANLTNFGRRLDIENSLKDKLIAQHLGRKRNSQQPGIESINRHLNKHTNTSHLTEKSQYETEK